MTKRSRKASLFYQNKKMKKTYEYKFYLFKLIDLQEAEDWINEKASLGYRIINIHHYFIDNVEYVRYTMERKL